MEQASNQAVFMTESHAQSLSLLFINTHCPRLTSLHSCTYLWDSLTKGLNLNQYSQMSRNVDVQ